MNQRLELLYFVGIAGTIGGQVVFKDPWAGMWAAYIVLAYRWAF